MENLRIEAVDGWADAELIAGALDRNEAAVRALIQRYNRRLYRVARSVVGNDAEAEDVLQDAYVRAFSALNGYRGEASLATWLTRIVVNEALQRLRHHKTHQLEAKAPGDLQALAEVIPFPLHAPLPDPEITMAQREICVLVEQAIDALPQEFRTVLVARTIEGMSTEETADAFGLKAETVKTRLHRARQMLRAVLEEHLGSQFPHVFPFDGVRCQRIADTVLARLGLQGGNLSA
ncbi:RNA polymerase sigma factor [Hyphomicrobium sp.]|uniref:RNA polymerase sigma factor n=1 Tax=Hyphomicrobium sp. TaxID=82 RepID=UPI002FE174F0